MASEISMLSGGAVSNTTARASSSAFMSTYLLGVRGQLHPCPRGRPDILEGGVDCQTNWQVGPKCDRGDAARNADRTAGADSDQRRGPRAPAVIPREPSLRPAPGPTEAPLRSTHWSGRPKTTVPSEEICLYPGGRVVLVSRMLQHAVKLG